MTNLSRAVLASYYNDARLNILHCLNHIREKRGNKPIENEDQIEKIFDDLSLAEQPPEEQKILIKQLRKHFRFLDVVVSTRTLRDGNDLEVQTATPEQYDKAIKWILKLVKELRNTMVHPTEKEAMLDYQTHRRFFFSTGKIYDASRRIVRQRFTIDANTMGALLRCVADRKKNVKIRPVDSFSFALCADPRDVNTEDALPQSKLIYDFGHVLFCSLFLEKNQSSELLNYFWGTGAGGKWSDEHKSIMTELISVYRTRPPFLRLESDNTETSVTVDALSELTRCPMALFESLSKENQDSFRGDPSSSHKPNRSLITETESTDLFRRNGHKRFVPLMMRFLEFDNDCYLRFAVDLGQYYYNVRFKHGKHYTDGKSKVRRLGQKLIGYGHLQQFEEWNKHESIPDPWKQLKDNHTQSAQEAKVTEEESFVYLKAYIVPTYPHYHYYDDKIGFRLADPDASSDLKLPVLKVDDPTSPGKQPASEGRLMQPEFWVSPNQLLQVYFYMYLQKGRAWNLRIDQLLLRYRIGMERLLNSLADKDPQLAGEPNSQERRQQVQFWIDEIFGVSNQPDFSVPLYELPKVVVNHLVGASTRKYSAESVIARVGTLIAETEQKETWIRDLINQDKKRGEKGYREIQSGKMAEFLSDDLMRFQRIQRGEGIHDGGKLNSQQYQILQASLAFYAAQIDKPPRIVDLLINSGLLTGEFRHEFLYQLGLEQNPDKYLTIVGFYQDYLKKRKYFLKSYKKELAKNGEFEAVPNWLRMKQISTLESWLKEFRDENDNLSVTNSPLPVPKNMLYIPILNWVAEALSVSPEQLYKRGTQHFVRSSVAGKKENHEIRPAINWLIQQYLKQHNKKNDGSQIMYEYGRSHPLFDHYLDDRTPTELFRKKKRNHSLTEEQRKAHLGEIKDRVVRMKDDSKKKKVEKEKYMSMLGAYKRRERRIRHTAAHDMLLYLFAERSLARDVLQLADSAPTPSWSLKELENTLLDTPIKYELPVTKTGMKLQHPSIKVRNLGEFRLLARDRRLKTLLPYYPKDKSVNQAEIRAQLGTYRKTKVKAMKQVHTLERKMVANWGDIPRRSNDQKKETSGYFGRARHGDFLYEIYKRFKQLDTEDAENLMSNPSSFDPSRFLRAVKIRNALSHNEYPEADLFPHIVTQVREDAVPANPDEPRKVAERLLCELNHLYLPWIAFINKSKRIH